MIIGMYSAASGMTAFEHVQQTITDNLANQNIYGHKRSIPRITPFDAAYAQDPQVASNMPNAVNAGRGAFVYDDYIDFSNGPVTSTENPMHLALDGDGFFEVETPWGLMYTRKGNVKITKEGTMELPEGFRFVFEGEQYGASKSIKINQGSELMVTVEGDVTMIVPGTGERTRIGTLRIVDFEKPYQMERVSSSLFKPREGVSPIEPKEVSVRQGFIERSNSNVISEMVGMISAIRSYEASARMIQVQDETLNKVINQVGAVT